MPANSERANTGTQNALRLREYFSKITHTIAKNKKTKKYGIIFNPTNNFY
jgi:hypothetical protein